MQNKESLIKAVFEKKLSERTIVLNKILESFNKRGYKEGKLKDYSFDYGKLYLNIDTFFQELDNKLPASSWHSPVIVVFGNINNKLSNKLFWKDKNIKEVIEKATIEFNKINDKTTEAIEEIENQYPNIKVSIAVISSSVNKGNF